jgi:chromosome segregation ATPase
MYNKQKADKDAGSVLGIPMLGASAFKNLIGYETAAQKEANKQVKEAYKGLSAPLIDTRASAERREALLSELTAAGKNIDTAIDDMQKKIKKIPKIGDLATNETSKAVADEFAKFGKMFVNGEAQIKDTKGLETAYEELYNKIEICFRYFKTSTK